MAQDPDATTGAVAYNRYLHIDELLTLQQPRFAGSEHDELLFIVSEFAVSGGNYLAGGSHKGAFG